MSNHHGLKRWQWAVRLLTRRMWFRAALFSLFGVALALVGAVATPFISYEFSASIGAKSVDSILNLLASSMLAVTTFSLTAMVQAYSGATSNITPRAVQLLIEDRTAQNALGTFLGSFLFAVVGLIALSTGIYGETGRVILYAGTVLVLVLIVVTFLRWIEHVTRFGRVSDTIDRVERAATRAVADVWQPPEFGPRRRPAVPAGAHPVFRDRIGRVVHVDTSALAEIARHIGADIHLAALPGAFVDPSRPVAHVAGVIDRRQEAKLAAAFTVQPDRAFDQDPRFGLVVLGEVASRALSPAVNDPGTAIKVLEAGTRVLSALLAKRFDDPDPGGPKVHVPAFAFPDLLEDLYRPTARDGAGLVEVGIRLQKSLGALAAAAPDAANDCRDRAQDALARAQAVMTQAADREKLARVHRRYWPGGD